MELRGGSGLEAPQCSIDFMITSTTLCDCSRQAAPSSSGGQIITCLCNHGASDADND